MINAVHGFFAFFLGSFLDFWKSEKCTAIPVTFMQPKTAIFFSCFWNFVKKACFFSKTPKTAPFPLIPPCPSKKLKKHVKTAKNAYFSYFKNENWKSAKKGQKGPKTRCAEMPPCREPCFSCFLLFKNGRKNRPCEKWNRKNHFFWHTPKTVQFNQKSVVDNQELNPRI